MVAQQVLRLAAGLAIVGTTIVGLAGYASADKTESTIIVDLRRGNDDERRKSRLAFETGLSGVSGLELVKDTELAAVLAGEDPDPTQRHAREQLAVAKAAYGSLDCAAVKKAASSAILLLSGLQAAGGGVDKPLGDAYVYLLLCADNAGDKNAAQAAAGKLRQLAAGDPPAGVGAAVWQRYPAPPVTPAPTVELHIKTAPEGATVWIDHRKIGTSPAVTKLPAGHYVVAAATGAGHSAVNVEASGTSTEATLAISENPMRWELVAELVTSWRTGARSANALALGRLMNEVGVRFVVVLAGTDQVEVWMKASDERNARRLRSGRLRAPFPIGAAIVEQAREWTGGQQDTLLREKRDPTIATKKRQKPRWWVYASVVGAVAVGAAIIIAQDLADDTQRIELSWP